MNRNSKFEIRNYKSGFTLFELLIVVALGSVLATVGFVTLSGPKQRYDVDAGVKDLVAALRETRIKSLTQQDGERWGVHMVSDPGDTDRYEVYTGVPYATSSVEDTYYLPSMLDFTEPQGGGTVTLSFAPVTGGVNATKIVTIVHRSRAGLLGNVIVDVRGGISFRDDHRVAGYWHLDEGMGTSTVDASGYGRSGTITSATWAATSTCVAGRCLSFNGTTSYVEIPSADSLNPGENPFSVEVWFKLNSAGSLNASILYNKESLYEASAGGGYFSYAWQPYWNWVSAFPVVTGQWYQAVVVYDGANQTVYKNGTAVYSRPQTGSMGTNANALRIGARGAPDVAGSFFPGVIDEVMVYNRALTADEVKAKYEELR